MGGWDEDEKNEAGDRREGSQRKGVADKGMKAMREVAMGGGMGKVKSNKDT